MIGSFESLIKGHIKVTDKTVNKVLVDTHNAINYEAMSIAMAQTLADWSVNSQRLGFIYSMAFGNGGSSVDPTGIITYLPPNVTSQTASLYNETYSKVIDQNSIANTDPTNNNMFILHTNGKTYTDIYITCLLDYGEPSGQQAFDNSTNANGDYVFDELGLKCWQGSTNNLMLITHGIFHPCQKALNRQILVEYTLRISSLTNLTG